MAQIERWEDCLPLEDGQLIRDGKGEILQVNRSPTGSGDIWLCRFSDEYGAVMNSREFYDHGHSLKFPLTTLKVVSDDE